jgi:glyceraldehyde-3-phosphate dehydrogenase (NADP+)
LSSQERAIICAEVGRQVAACRDDLARSICDEAGKPIQDAQAEVDRALFCFELAAAEASRSAAEGELLPMDLRPAGRSRIGLVRRVPVGAVAAISPFTRWRLRWLVAARSFSSPLRRRRHLCCGWPR